MIPIKDGPRKKQQEILRDYYLNNCYGQKNQKKQSEIFVDIYQLYHKDKYYNEHMDIVYNSSSFHDTQYRLMMTKDNQEIAKTIVLVSNSQGTFVPTPEEHMEFWIRQRIKVLKMIIKSNNQHKLGNLNNQIAFTFSDDELEVIKTMGDSLLLNMVEDPQENIFINNRTMIQTTLII